MATRPKIFPKLRTISPPIVAAPVGSSYDQTMHPYQKRMENVCKADGERVQITFSSHLHSTTHGPRKAPIRLRAVQ